jgi:hypothetical protein
MYYTYTYIYICFNYVCMDLNITQHVNESKHDMYPINMYNFYVSI